MNRRQVLRRWGLGVLFLAGCGGDRSEDSRWDTEFTVRGYECLDGEDVEDSNSAGLEQTGSQIRVRGAISDGEPRRTAKLGDVALDSTTLYITIKTIPNTESPKDCSLIVEYTAEIDVGEGNNQIDEIVVQHNGKRVKT
ncbi:hypothetical protein [Halorarum salinum]|uniref:Lipoprotein n=1 Tax=Halorarum salinum TaxID=2743089 RepID=A0A7D5LCR1_9EURY|nr:hypothetical protein [Halobaculum salinum]QLG63550.1 hypothetical protein HUG12_18175 [Halobaculum salinum]